MGWDREARGGGATAEGQAEASRLAAENERARLGQSIVRDVAARLGRQLGGRVPCSDLESIGNEALVTLIRDYNPAASPFEPYLRRFLRWAMLDALRGRSMDTLLGRRAKALTGCMWLAAANDTSEDEPSPRPALDEWRESLGLRATALALTALGADGGIELSADSAGAPDRVAMRDHERRAVRDAVAGIEDSAAREVLVRHYFGDEPFEQIATGLGLSPTQICRMHRGALLALDSALRRRGVSSVSR